MAKQNVEITIQAPKAGAPANLLARAELSVKTGLLAGLRITGFALWRATAEDGRQFVSVTFPSQAVDRGSKTLYYDYLRGSSADAKRVKGAIVRAYRETAREGGQDFAEDLGEGASAAQDAGVPF